MAKRKFILKGTTLYITIRKFEENKNLHLKGFKKANHLKIVHKMQKMAFWKVKQKFVAEQTIPFGNYFTQKQNIFLR